MKDDRVYVCGEWGHVVHTGRGGWPLGHFRLLEISM